MSRTPRLPIWKLADHEQAQLLRLKAEALTIEQLLSPNVQALIDMMVPTMYAAHGIGLAAPQVGHSLRLAIISREITHGVADMVMVNPNITPIGMDQVRMEEGCLSVPKVYGLVPRWQHLRLTALDRQGQPYELEAMDLFARVIQHEVDHLQGQVFLDRVTSITHGRPPK